MERLAIDTPAEGTITAVADDLYWARFALPFRLNHINLYMIDTYDGLVLIDTGINDEVTARHWQILLEGPLSGKPISAILVTHHHVDHIGYAGKLQQITGAPVWMSAEEAEVAKWLIEQDDDVFSALVADTYQRYGLDEESCAIARSDKGRFRRHVAPLPDLTIISENHHIKSKSGTWRIRIDGGHSQAHIGLSDEKRGLYIAVDFLLPRISPNISVDLRYPAKDNLGFYLSFLSEMTDMDESWQVFPGHDWPFTKGASRARSLISHHENRLSALIEAAQDGPITVFQAMSVLFGKSFAAHELYFATGEARAHLGHLVATNKMMIVEKSDDKGVDYFALSQP
ncbi:MAG: MBL fold metallo-hydrolase [Candidatus Puniceispirillaceae bacterium]